MKQISFGKEAVEKLMVGLDKAADSVSGTIGPKGRNVYFETSLGYEFTNDGVTVANQVQLKDKEEDAGAYIIRNVSSQQNDDAGDGTTTVSVLTQAIVHECLKRPENPTEIRESLNEASQKVLQRLVKKSITLKKEDIEKVAYISSESTEIAKLISEIIGKLGDKAVINVEDSKTFKTDYEIVDGYEAPVGFMSPHFINNKNGKAIYEDVPVLVTEKKIQNVVDIMPLFEEFKKQGINQCVIVCDDIDDSMLGVFVQNKAMGLFNALVIRATGDTLKDIEGITGAHRVADGTGITFKGLRMDHLGRATKIICDATKTLFLGTDTKNYANLLEMQTQNEDNQYVKKQIDQRLAKLRGGIATLRIAAPTDAERIYLRRKAEDAVKATLAALEEGVVEGGGMTLLRLSDLDIFNSGASVGSLILSKALKAPFKKIVENAGHDYADIIHSLPKDKGYNARSGQYVDMVESGILDPTKVVRCAVENAVSTAGMLITTFALITPVEDGKE